MLQCAQRKVRILQRQITTEFILEKITTDLNLKNSE